LTQIESPFQVALIFLHSRPLQQVIRLEAKPFTLVGSASISRWIRPRHSGLPSVVTALGNLG
jgi:hypothetical protein